MMILESGYQFAVLTGRREAFISKKNDENRIVNIMGKAQEIRDGIFQRT